jgi:hypothetical protein
LSSAPSRVFIAANPDKKPPGHNAECVMRSGR